MSYASPKISDYGTLVELTQASGLALTEDGAGKAIVVDVNPIAELTLQVLP